MKKTTKLRAAAIAAGVLFAAAVFAACPGVEATPIAPEARFFPEPGSAGAHVDGELAIVFDEAPALNRDGAEVRIYDAWDGTLAAAIPLSGARLLMMGTSNNNHYVGDQLARIEGNVVYVRIPTWAPQASASEQNRRRVMQYDREYRVEIADGVITGRIDGEAFVGVSGRDWTFATRSAPTLSEAVPVTVDRSRDSDADFRSVFGAMEAVSGRGGSWTIHVAPGVYNELVNYNAGANVAVVGRGSAPFGGDVVIRWTNNQQMNEGTHLRASFRFSGADLVLKNVALENATRRTGSGNWQAETLFFANGAPTAANPRGRTVAAYNSSFLSYQDTVQTTGRAWFYRCRVEGDLDYVWGTSEATLVESCELVSLRDPMRNDANAIVFVSRAQNRDGFIGKGYVLLNSRVTTMPGAVTRFARNVGANGVDQVAVINNVFLNVGTGTVNPNPWSGGTHVTGGFPPESVGLKTFGNSMEDGSPLALSGPTHSVMAEEHVAAEYGGRRAILNRWFNVASGEYADRVEWDIGALETLFGAGPDPSRRP